MVKITFEFETKAEAAAFLAGEDAPKKPRKSTTTAADLMGDTEEEEEEEEKPVTMKQIQPVLQKVADAGKGDEVKKILKKMGATGGVSTLPKPKYKAFLKALNEIEVDE
jgi:hypothetical protein